MILYNKINGTTSFSKYRLVAQKLSELEEEVIISYILNRDSRGFSPRQANIEDIVNYLLKTRRVKPIGKL
jgi:hypothetical protein